MTSDDRPAITKPGGWIPSDSGTEGGKLHAPAVERNTEPILAVLQDVVASADPKRALELASGSGQHAIAFAEAFPNIVWQPSDRDPAGLVSIAAWRSEAGHNNLLEPVHIDLDDPDWTVELQGTYDLIVACNLLHISPWHVTLNLLGGAAHLLSETGRLVVYGCFSRSGDYVSESNWSFDQSLRQRNPTWGVRDTDAVAGEAINVGLEVERTVPMPSNNTVLILRRTG